MKCKVLIVDDESVTAGNTALILEEHGHSCRSAASKTECLALLTGGYRPDIVLMDIFLGEQKPDGVETADEIYRRWDLPVIFFSGYSEAAVVSRTKRVPSYGSIPKGPGNEQFILSSVEQAAALHERQRQLRESEERYRTCFEQAPIGVFRATREGRYLEVNQRFAEMLGYSSPAELQEETPGTAGAFAAGHRGWTELADETISSGETLHFDPSIRRRDGSEFAGSLYLSALREGEDELPALHGMLNDVSKRREMEARLLEQRRTLETILENTSDVIVRTDLEGRYIYANSQLYRHTGLSPEQYLGKTNEELGAPREICERLYAAGREVYYNREPRKITFPFDTADMGRRWFQANTCPEFDNRGRVVSLLHFIRDITELQELFDSLSDREGQLRSILTAMHEGVIVYSREGKLLFSNSRAHEILGCSEEELSHDGAPSGRKCCRLLHSDGTVFPEEEHPAMITLRTGKAQRHVPMAVERSDGRRVWISVNAEPLCPQKQSDIAGVVVSFRDMTREREREERIREYAEEREHLLTEINHRVKNNLYTVEALANIELRATGKGKHEALQDIISRVRAISLVHQKLYSSGDFEEVKADEYLRDLVRALASASYPSPSGNAIECRAEALSLPPKKITSLGLIVSELITNTVKHSRSPAETSITLSLRREGEQAVLDYRDTGGGLPPEVTSIDQLGPGTGMRLVKMLAKDLEGEVSIPDRPAEKTDDTVRGARFRVVFPLEPGTS